MGDNIVFRFPETPICEIREVCKLHRVEQLERVLLFLSHCRHFLHLKPEQNNGGVCWSLLRQVLLGKLLFQFAWCAVWNINWLIKNIKKENIFVKSWNCSCDITLIYLSSLHNLIYNMDVKMCRFGITAALFTENEELWPLSLTALWSPFMSSLCVVRVQCRSSSSSSLMSFSSSS